MFSVARSPLSALKPAFEVGELYDQRYGQLMKAKGVEG